MSTWLKTLIVLALVVPMMAYVVGSLLAARAGDPADRGPVIIEDASSPAAPRPAKDPVRRTGNAGDQDASPGPTPVDRDDKDDRDGPNDRDGGTARVVTPQPTSVDDDDDDEAVESDDSHDTDDEEPEHDDDEGDD